MKTDIQKLESVLSEYERRKMLTEESLSLADEVSRPRLSAIHNDITSEINRLLMVKAEMMARIKRAKAMLLLAVAMRRRRFRAF